jgi:hypothetical protein
MEERLVHLVAFDVWSSLWNFIGHQTVVKEPDGPRERQWWWGRYDPEVVQVESVGDTCVICGLYASHYRYTRDLNSSVGPMVFTRVGEQRTLWCRSCLVELYVNRIRVELLKQSYYKLFIQT